MKGNNMTSGGGALRRTSITATAALALAIAGCSKKPTDQVVAIVNGEEISLPELNAELGNAQVPEGVDKKAVQQQLLQRLVDRRLLAQAAKEQGLDRDPAFIVDQRRVQESLLVEKLAKKTNDSIPVPTAAEIDKYISGNPTLFAGRQLYTVDQLAFATPTDATKLRALEPAKTMDQVITVLRGLGIGFQRANRVVDSATVPPEQMTKITSLPKGEPFVVPTNGQVTVNVITGGRAEPLPDAQARQVAVRLIRSQALAKQGEQRLKDARTKAKIEYQTGFAPPATPGAPGAAPAAAAK
jgi:peptidyl-prolyl cis-trans isomerase C